MDDRPSELEPIKELQGDDNTDEGSLYLMEGDPVHVENVSTDMLTSY